MKVEKFDPPLTEQQKRWHKILSQKKVALRDLKWMEDSEKGWAGDGSLMDAPTVVPAYYVNYDFGHVTISRLRLTVDKGRSKFIVGGKELSFSSSFRYHPRWESAVSGAIAGIELRIKGSAKKVRECRKIQADTKRVWRESVKKKRLKEQRAKAQK